MEQPLAVNAENSRAKVQNVGGDSSEDGPRGRDASFAGFAFSFRAAAISVITVSVDGRSCIGPLGSTIQHIPRAVRCERTKCG